MVATVNLPGSSYFAYFQGPRAACRVWLAAKEREHQQKYQGTWCQTFSPGRITSNAVARTWRYRDGRPVIARDTL